MDGSEPVVAQSSDIVEPNSSSHHSSDHIDLNLDATISDANAATSVAPAGSLDDAASHMNSSSVGQENSVVAASEEENRLLVPGHDANQTTELGESTSMGLNAGATYATYANGNEVGDVNGNGTSAHGGLMVTAEQQFQDGEVLSTEEERLWSIVKANSLDFNAWTSLIEETEKMSQDNILKIRKVYDAFLAEFPLCYGYWKKYADHEARFGATDKVVEVYERAILGVTYSVDIWLHYCGFAIGTYGDPDTIRRLFERALAYVGTDYLSYPLWDKYIEYEYTQQEWGRLAMIYTRLLEHPNQQLDRYFTSFKELAGSRPLAELKVAEEAAAITTATVSSDADGKENEKDASADAMDESTKPENASLSEAEELEKYIAIREEMYKKAKEFDSKIIGFETAIRRPYFHVRPLNDAELENWHNYLDFIERDGDFSKIFKLYERCLIACANYPEFWIRYILCMEANGSIDLAENALARATQVFVKRQPEIHLFASRFKEEHGDVSGARASYQLVHSEISPGLLEAIIDHANMERRLGHIEDAFSVYEQAIAIEKGKELSQTLPALFAQYSRFVHLVCRNPQKARDILFGALEHVQLSKPLLEAIIYFESIQSLPKQVEQIDSLVDKFITPAPDNSDVAGLHEKEELSSIYLEFLGLFGDVQSIKTAKDRHARLFLRHRSSSVSRKRRADDFLTSDNAKISKSYSAVSSTVSPTMGAYPTAQGQWTAGYGSQPVAWPQATQAQAQSYNTSYVQQAAYSGYYGGSYAPQQIAASAPQAPAYGTYPSAYPVQETPQQAYVAPVATATIPATQPAAPVPQAYPNGYY